MSRLLIIVVIVDYCCWWWLLLLLLQSKYSNLLLPMHMPLAAVCKTYCCCTNCMNQLPIADLYRWSWGRWRVL